MRSGSIVFVDTPVLIYADDERDPDKHAKARAWIGQLWERRAGRISSQILNEYYVVVTRKLRPGLPQGDARAKVRRFQLWQPWQIDHQTVESAWGIEARFGFHYWDALLLAAAAQAGCSVLLSEDMQHGQQIDRVRILNPFKTQPEEVFS